MPNNTDYAYDPADVVDPGVLTQFRPLTPGFMILSSILVLLMQLGFAQLEVGVAPLHSSQNIMMKNMLDTAVAALGFYACGYAFAYGTSPASNGFIGTGSFFIVGVEPAYEYFVQFAYVNNAATVSGGPMVGRTRLSAYMLVSLYISTFAYPVFAHWVWSEQGWLQTTFAYKPLDFVGGGPVHLLGAMCGLLGSIVIGPRATFDHVLRQKDKYETSHNKLLAASGAYLLWISWMAFTSVSAGHVFPQNQIDVVGRVAACTMLSGAAAGVTSYVVRKLLGMHYDIIHLGNSMLVGLASITAGCGVVQPWAAILIGTVASLLFLVVCRIVERFRIDDPVDAAAVHLTGGIWGLIAAGLFAEPALVASIQPGALVDAAGLFYGGHPAQFGIQLLEIVAAIVWTLVSMYPLFWILHRLGKLRVSKETELGGIDLFKHGAGQNASHGAAPNVTATAQVQQSFVDTGNPFDSAQAAEMRRGGFNGALYLQSLFHASPPKRERSPSPDEADEAVSSEGARSKARSRRRRVDSVGAPDQAGGNWEADFDPAVPSPSGPGWENWHPAFNAAPWQRFPFGPHSPPAPSSGMEPWMAWPGSYWGPPYLHAAMHLHHHPKQRPSEPAVAVEMPSPSEQHEGEESHPHNRTGRHHSSSSADEAADDGASSTSLQGRFDAHEGFDMMGIPPPPPWFHQGFHAGRGYPPYTPYMGYPQMPPRRSAERDHDLRRREPADPAAGRSSADIEPARQ